MNHKKLIAALFTSTLLFLLVFASFNSFAGPRKHAAMMKDCCMMKNGKMVIMKSGKMKPMNKDMTMKNGTTCTTHGECILKNGEKKQMKDGECIDMKGKMDNCKMMHHTHTKKMHHTHTKKMKKEMKTYTCSMHPEVISGQPGKCSKCGMDLDKKN